MIASPRLKRRWLCAIAAVAFLMAGSSWLMHVMVKHRQRDVWIAHAESLELQVYVLPRYIGTASNDFELFRSFLAGERVEILILSDREARLLLSTPGNAPDDLTIAIFGVAPVLESEIGERFHHANVEALRYSNVDGQ